MKVGKAEFKVVYKWLRDSCDMEVDNAYYNGGDCYEHEILTCKFQRGDAVLLYYSRPKLVELYLSNKYYKEAMRFMKMNSIKVIH